MIDAEQYVVPGSRDVSEVLSTDPLYSVLGLRLANPVVLGLAIFLMALIMIVLGTSSESRFIYTDF